MTLSKFMKNKYISAAATLVAAAALVLTGCSNDIDNSTEDNTPTDNIVRFDIGVQDDMGTRAIITNENLQSAVTAETPIYFENDFCSGKIVNNGGSWTGTRVGSQDGLPLIWRDRGAATYVIATLGGQYTKTGGFQVDFPTDQSQDIPDFLFFMQNDFVPSENGGKVNINFKHKFAIARIVFNGPEGEFTNVKLGGTITEVKTGTPTLDGLGIPMLEAAENGNRDLITPHQEPSDGSPTYECSVIPQTVSAGNLFVSFTLNGKDYIWSSTKDMTFAEGKRNTITINVQ